MATKFINYKHKQLVRQRTTLWIKIPHFPMVQTGDGLSASDGSKAVIMIGCMVANILTVSRCYSYNQKFIQ